MKSLLIVSVLTIAAFLLLPAMTFAQASQAGAGPPLAQPLVREGTLAVELVSVLHLGQTTNETDAESLLSAAGIAPRNGWVADYPVTPDIAGELRAATAEAAAGGSLKMTKDVALSSYDSVMTQYNLSVKAGDAGQSESAQAAPNYPDTAAYDDYYYDYGPPVVTYYAPPVDYAYLYSWVPYPFWWWSFWFPGFFVLVDFDVPVFIGGHACFVTNHFFDRDDHAFVRINAFDRFHSATFATRTTVVGPTVVSTTSRTTFSRLWGSGDNRVFRTTANGTIIQGSEGSRTLSRSGSRSFVPERHGTVSTVPNREGGTVRSNRSFSAPSSRQERPFSGARPFEGSSGMRSVAPSSRSFSAPSQRQASPFNGARPFEGSSGMRSAAPSSRSFSAPAPRQFSPSFGGGRAFEGFGGGSFGGMRGR